MLFSKSSYKSKKRLKNSSLSKSLLIITILILGAICLAGLAAPYIAPNDPYDVNLSNVLQAPSRQYPFGTDSLGRCVFSRVIYGGNSTIFSSLIVVAVTFAVGTLIGVVSGYFGGLLDRIIMRIVDIFLSFPGMVLAIAVAGILGGGIRNAMIAIALIGWTKYTRISRSRVLELKEETYIKAAKLSGKSSFYIIRTHIVPNILGYQIITASLDIGTTIMEMSSLAFLGLSSPLPLPEWGSMISEGKSIIQFAPWTIIAPGAALLIVVILFNLLGDSVRDMLDEKQKKNK